MSLWFRRTRRLTRRLRGSVSTGGFGLSFGARGLRVGVGPRGWYAAASRGGFYWRSGAAGMILAAAGLLATC